MLLQTPAQAATTRIVGGPDRYSYHDHNYRLDTFAFVHLLCSFRSKLSFNNTIKPAIDKFKKKHPDATPKKIRKAAGDAAAAIDSNQVAMPSLEDAVLELPESLHGMMRDSEWALKDMCEVATTMDEHWPAKDANDTWGLLRHGMMEPACLLAFCRIGFTSVNSTLGKKTAGWIKPHEDEKEKPCVFLLDFYKDTENNKNRWSNVNLKGRDSMNTLSSVDQLAEVVIAPLFDVVGPNGDGKPLQDRLASDFRAKALEISREMAIEGLFTSKGIHFEKKNKQQQSAVEKRAEELMGVPMKRLWKDFKVALKKATFLLTAHFVRLSCLRSALYYFSKTDDAELALGYESAQRALNINVLIFGYVRIFILNSMFFYAC